MVAVAFLIVPVGLGGWTLTRDDTSTWPSNPRLKFSLEASGSNQGSGRVHVDGTADDLYVGDRGDETSVVTRYIEGKVRWRADVGYPTPARLEVIDDLVFLVSGDFSDDLALDERPLRLDRLDPETGEVMWTITAVGTVDFKVIDGRLYVDKRVAVEDDSYSLFEYDINTGEELNTASMHQYVFVGDDWYFGDESFIEDQSSNEGRFIEIDNDGLTLGLLDLDFQPVGEPVSIERSWTYLDDPMQTTLSDLVWSRHEDGWVYYSDRTEFGGIASAVGLSDNGEIQFECETVVDDAHSVRLRDGSTLMVWGLDEAEVLDIDGPECTSRWHVAPAGRTSIGFHQYPVIVSYDEAEDDPFDFEDKEISVLDWDTGQPIITGKGVYHFNDTGDWLTSRGDIMIAQNIDSGAVRWQVAASTEDQVWVGPDLVAVITEDPESSTIDVYGD